MAAFTRPSKSLRAVGVGLPHVEADAALSGGAAKERSAAPRERRQCAVPVHRAPARRNSPKVITALPGAEL